MTTFVDDNIRQPILCVLGPTAAGKTGLAVDLCQRFPFEIISVDSALVYRKMDIGTAKPDAETRRLAPHALIDLIEPWQTYSVSQFLTAAREEIIRVARAGRIPLLTGGTMLYFHTLWNGLSALPQSDAIVRTELQQSARKNGWQQMHDRLTRIDPVSAARIHPNDPQRLLRALEVYEISGVPMSTLQSKRVVDDSRDFFNIAILPSDRALLHQRIAQRFEQMLAMNFEAEVHGLMELPQMHSELASMRCVGYRQMWSWIDNQCTRDEMVEQAVAATRQLAKRQLTWMRRMPDLHALDTSPSIDDLLALEEFNGWLEVQGLV